MSAKPLTSAEFAEFNAILWACVTCGSKVLMGELIALDLLRCPNCKSADVHVADGRARVAPGGYSGVVVGHLN